jgi:ASCH domain-containing protein
MRAPIVGRNLERVVPRSFGASVQVVQPRGRAVVEALLGDAAGRSTDPHATESITHGLLILKEPLDKILAGTKTWEIRGEATARRGPIALIESKSGHVVGTCDIVDVVGPLTLAKLQRTRVGRAFGPTSFPTRPPTHGSSAMPGDFLCPFRTDTGQGR